MLGILVMSAVVPTINSVLGEMLPVLGFSLLLFTLVAGLIGMVFGFFAARGFTMRLGRLAEAASTWSQGDFAVNVNDPSGDELGLLAKHFNNMAGQLQLLFDTRRELTVVEERNRLARDLHDSVKQQAFAAAAQISAARKMLEQNPIGAQTHVEEAEQLIFNLRQELTSLILELRPAALEDNGLSPAVRTYAADWSRQNGIKLAVLIKHEQALPLQIEQGVFRLVQEALSNIARHSQASSAEIEIAFSKQELSCSIHDNGIGFDVENSGPGFGLKSMGERLQGFGGHMIVESIPGRGTMISFVVPLIEPHESEGSEING